MCIREVVHRFTLDEDRRASVHDTEVSEMTVLNSVALVVGREKELLVEGDATERQFDSQCVLVHVLVEEGSEVFVHLLARTQGRVDELFVCGFVCVSHCSFSSLSSGLTTVSWATLSISAMVGIVPSTFVG